MGLTAFAQLFKPRANVHPAKTTIRPHPSRVQCAPIASASAPARKLPIGTRPRKQERLARRGLERCDNSEEKSERNQMRNESRVCQGEHGER